MNERISLFCAKDCWENDGNFMTKKEEKKTKQKPKSDHTFQRISKFHVKKKETKLFASIKVINDNLVNFLFLFEICIQKNVLMFEYVYSI